MFHDFYAQSRHLIWPLLGLLIFLAGFAGVLIYVLFGLRDPERVRRLARLPLESDEQRTPVPVDPPRRKVSRDE
jgi:hypothetical protein